MPELPEVETVRSTLELHLKKDIITHVTPYYEKLITGDPNIFYQSIKGQTIQSISRMGKYLIFVLDDDALIIHLRMEGKFYIKTPLDPVLKHEHMVFHLKSGRELRYHDVRKFGTLTLLPRDQYMELDPLNRLGLEPKDQKLETFFSRINKKNIEIKAVLLDQHIISGLGNIYVDETLFHAKIHPTRKANQITLDEADAILKSAIKVLDKAVALGGTTIRSYTSSMGVHGRFQNELCVHTKRGQPCPICQTTIIKMKVKGRGTYVCPTCQT